MVHRDSVEELLVATVGLHLRKEEAGHGGQGVRVVQFGVCTGTLGTLVSLLQQREKALLFVEEGGCVGCGGNGDGDGDGDEDGEEEVWPGERN